MKKISRDELVQRGEEARIKGEETHNPWIYYAKVKVGNRATRNITKECYSIRHLVGETIEELARAEEAISIYCISRVMKSQVKSTREDI